MSDTSQSINLKRAPENVEPENMLKHSEDPENKRIKMIDQRENEQKIGGNVEEVKKVFVESSSEHHEQAKLNETEKLSNHVSRLRQKNRETKEKIAEIEAKSSEKNKETRYEIRKLKEKILKIESKLEEKNVETEKIVEKQADSKIQKLKEVISEMKKEHKYEMTMASKLIEKLDDRISTLETNQKQTRHSDKCACCGPPVFSLCKKMDIPLTASEIEFESKCIFCESTEHKSIDCRKYSDYTERRNKLIDLNRCEKCLEPNNSIDKKKHIPCSRAMIACVYCVHDITEYVYEWNFHHSIVCKFNDESLFRETRREKDNEFRKSINMTPLFFMEQE